MGTSGRTVAETVAGTLGISFEQYKPMIQFAVALNTIVYNCDDEAMHVIFDPANPQSVKYVKQLANTSDVRQRFRINKVLGGESSTIRPQGPDPVFDTIAFSEVPIRLARARGVLVKLSYRYAGIKDLAASKELKRLLRLTQDATNQLGNLVLGKATSASAMGRLDKISVFPILQSRIITGRDVGYGRQALRLTIKNVQATTKSDAPAKGEGLFGA